MNSILTSVIVCTRNRPIDIHNFLLSLKKQICLPNELIIVDSSDTSLLENSDFKNLFNSQNFPSIKLIYRHTNPGLTLQRNIGISLAIGEILYFFDDDVILNSDYIQKMNEIFVSKPQYAGGMGTVTNLSLRINNFSYYFFLFFRKFFFLQRNFSKGKFTFSGMPTHAYGTQKFRDVQVLGGCCMAYRSFVFLNNKFDENLKYYSFMEDCDFSKRISKSHKLFYNPQAKLVHNESTANRNNAKSLAAMITKYYSYLFFKNFYQENRFRIVAYCWSILGLFIEAILRRKFDNIKGYADGLKQYFFDNK